MSELEHYQGEPSGGGLEPRRLNPLSRWMYSGQIAHHDARSVVQARAINNEAQLAQLRAQAIEYVADGALGSQARLSEAESLYSRVLPDAAGQLAYLSHKGTVGLGKVIDQAAEEVTECRGRCWE